MDDTALLLDQCLLHAVHVSNLISGFLTVFEGFSEVRQIASYYLEIANYRLVKRVFGIFLVQVVSMVSFLSMDTSPLDLFWYRDYLLFLKRRLDDESTQDWRSQVIWIHGDYWVWKTRAIEILRHLYLEQNGHALNVINISAWRNYYDNPDSVWKAMLYGLSEEIYKLFASLTEDQIDKESFANEVKTVLESYLWQEVSWKIENALRKNVWKSWKSVRNDAQNICIEIQRNLYQDLRNFDSDLRSFSSRATTAPLSVFGSVAKFAKTSGFISVLAWGAANIAVAAKSAADFSSLLKKESQELKKPRVETLDLIQRRFDTLIGLYRITHRKSGPLLIVIDDLDRILPDKAVEILEILRIFFEKSSNVHFIVAIDNRAIEKWIERKFNNLRRDEESNRIEIEEYLEKIITIPFDLPPIPKIQMGDGRWVESVIVNSMPPISPELLPETEHPVAGGIINVSLWGKLLGSLGSRHDLAQKKSPDERADLKFSASVRAYEIYKNKFLLSNPLWDESVLDGGGFLSLVRVGLQSNPRKVRRFMEVFDIYFQIFLYRYFASAEELEWFIQFMNGFDPESPDATSDERLSALGENSLFLAKFLIVKLEWDEIYKEFVKDKFFLSVLEDIAVSYDKKLSFSLIEKYIRKSKKYKMSSLFSLLAKPPFWWTNMTQIYNVYFLRTFENFDKEKLLVNEWLDFDTVKHTILRYLYEEDEIKVGYYLKMLEDMEAFSKRDFEYLASVMENFKEYSLGRPKKMETA